jgi:ASC-1-like (ASCH) protein
LDKVTTIRVKDEEYKSIKNGKIIVIDGVNYIPVKVVNHPVI